MSDSTVRKNLMTRRGYSPYCGADNCRKGSPRTTFNGKQFFCTCGWKSSFPSEFIKSYLDHWTKVEESYVEGANNDFERYIRGLF